MSNLEPKFEDALAKLQKTRDHTDDWRAKLLLHGGLVVLGVISLFGAGLLPVLIGAAALSVFVRRNRRKLIATAATIALALNFSLIITLAVPEGVSEFWTFWAWYPVYVLFVFAIFLPSVAECLDAWSSVKAIWLDSLVAPAALQFSPIIFLIYVALRLHSILFGIKSFRKVRAGYSRKRLNGLVIGRYVLTAILIASLFPLYSDPLATAIFSIMAYRMVQFASLIAGHRLTAMMDNALAETGKVVFGTGRGLVKGGAILLKGVAMFIVVMFSALFVLLKVILFVALFAAMLSAGDPSGPGFEIGGGEGFDALGGFEGFGEGFGGIEGGTGLEEWELSGFGEGGVDGLSGADQSGGEVTGVAAEGIGGGGVEASGAEGIDLNADGVIEGYDLNGDGLIDVNQLGVEINSLQEVDGYMRDDGTYVESYVRTEPDGSVLNNLNPSTWIG